MKDFTSITIILDKSASMASATSKTIEGFNAFVLEQAALGENADLTLVQFGHQVDPPTFTQVPIQQKPQINAEQYIANGRSTALLDAIGITITTLGNRLAALPEAERPNHVIVVIITDGQENSSHEFSKARIQAMLHEQQEKYSWTILYLAADLSGVGEAESLGIRRNLIANYQGTQNTKRVYSAASKATIIKRTKGSMDAADYSLQADVDEPSSSAGN